MELFQKLPRIHWIFNFLSSSNSLYFFKEVKLVSFAINWSWVIFIRLVSNIMLRKSNLKSPFNKIM